MIKLVKVGEEVEGSPLNVFVLVVPTRSSSNINSYSPAFKMNSNGVFLQPVNEQCMPDNHWQHRWASDLSRSSLGTDENIVNQIHGGYWQFLVKYT